VTLQAQTLLAQGIGIPAAAGGRGLPLPDGSFTPPAGPLTAGVLLYPDEVAAIRQRVNELNSAIATAASANGAFLLDIHEIFEDAKKEGIDVGGISFTPAFLTGGLFSADGFHPSNIAHALVADYLVQLINARRNANIPRPNLAQTFFAPDLPPAAGVTGGTFTDTMWRALLGHFPPVDGLVEVVIPAVPSSRTPRTVDR
jgi:hypothetical protein